MRQAMILGALLAPGLAHGFCGTFVSSGSSTLVNEVAQAVIVREGNTTVLTVSNDVHGDVTADFGLLIPVPEVLDEDQVHVVDPDVFARLDAYSAPRLVSYTCEDFEETDSGVWAAQDGAGNPSDSESEVEVEARYTVGEYDVAILSATGGDALEGWLADNGFNAPSDEDGVLDDYIEGGNYFLAARIDPEFGIEDGDVLSPLQFRYQTPTFSLPIRIGTLNSDGVQELIVYAINRYSEGRVGISNYTEATVQDECQWDSTGETFAEFYSGLVEDAHTEAGALVWINEYAWGAAGCDPCQGTPPDDSDVATLGYGELDTDSGWNGRQWVEQMHFTRLHLRYTPDQVTSDLSLYTSGDTTQSQQRYIEYEDYLEDRYVVCGESEIRDDPGSCDPTEAGCNQDASGCGGNAMGVFLLGLPLALLRRRQRTQSSAA